MKKVFIDCGANHGQGLRQFMSMFNMDSTWDIHSYEPTPGLDLDEDLMNLENVTFHRKAVWSKNGTIDFSLCIPTEEWKAASEGSSVVGLLDAGECIDPNSPQFRKHDNIVKVETVDICSILKKFSNDDYIVVKLDIEGSEYEVCRKLLETEDIVKINTMFVEWHVNIVGSESHESTNELKNRIRSYGVELHDWY